MEEKVCKKCNNKRHIFEPGKGWVRCSCVNEIRANRIMSKSGFPEALWEISDATFKIKPDGDLERKRLAKDIKKMVKNNSKQPVFIYSDSIDKDRVAAIISRYMAIVNPSIETISYSKLDKIVQRNFKKDVDETIVDPFTADITVITIGDEITNKAHQNVLYNILYDRILGEKFTIICSFVPQNRILQIYHKAVDQLMSTYFTFYSC